MKNPMPKAASAFVTAALLASLPAPDAAAAPTTAVKLSGAFLLTTQGYINFNGASPSTMSLTALIVNPGPDGNPAIAITLYHNFVACGPNCIAGEDADVFTIPCTAPQESQVLGSTM